MDEFAAFAAKSDKTESEQQLWYICTRGHNENRSVSRVPFSHLVASYQAALKDVNKTIEIIERTEYSDVAKDDAEIIRAELKFIDEWLGRRAPDDVKFSLLPSANENDFSTIEKQFFAQLAEKIVSAPAAADGAWFHQAIYEFKDKLGLQPKDMFGALYKLIIGKTSGPRAGWFLSILPRDWLLARLRFELSPEKNV
jgi:lysyl-tRNA synthetase class 1